MLRTNWLQTFPDRQSIELAGQQLQQAANEAYQSGQTDPQRALGLMKVVEQRIAVDQARVGLNTDAGGRTRDKMAEQRLGQNRQAYQDFNFVLQQLQNPAAIYHLQNAQTIAAASGAPVAPLAGQSMFVAGGIDADRQANMFGTFARAATDSGDWFSFAYFAEGVRALGAVEHLAQYYNRSARGWEQGRLGGSFTAPQLYDKAVPQLEQAVLEGTDRKINFLERLVHALEQGNKTAEAGAVRGLVDALQTKKKELLAAQGGRVDDRLDLISELAGINQLVDTTVAQNVQSGVIPKKQAEQAAFGVTVKDRFRALHQLAKEANLMTQDTAGAAALYDKGDSAAALRILGDVKKNLDDALKSPGKKSVELAYGPLIRQLDATIEILERQPTSTASSGTTTSSGMPAGVLEALLRARRS